jgi:type I restriction enzyme, S subunit
MLKRVKIGDLIKQKKAHSQTGPFGTQLKASDYVKEGTPVINVRNIGFGDIRIDSLEFLNEDMVKELKNHIIRDGDIVFGRKGAVERHSLISEKEDGWIQGSDCIRLRFLTEEYYPTFISFFFRTAQHKQWMINLGSFGATMGSLNQEIISKIEIPDISLPIQTKIAQILSNYDELIVNNKQRIKLLEEMAQEIYKEWFVRMRFPGYETAMFYNEAGEQVKHGTVGALPEGWERIKLVELFNINYGNNLPQTVILERGKYPVYGASGIMGYYHHFNVEQKAVLITSRGNGSGEIHRTHESAFVTNNSFVVLAKEKYKYLEIGFNFQFFNQLHLKSYCTGSAQPQLTNNSMMNIEVFLPTEELVRSFCNISNPKIEMIDVLINKNQLLQRTRDLLLPRLISGKLSVGAFGGGPSGDAGGCRRRSGIC